MSDCTLLLSALECYNSSLGGAPCTKTVTSGQITQCPNQSQAPTCHEPADPLGRTGDRVPMSDGESDGNTRQDTNLGWHEELQAKAFPSHSPSQK